MIPDPQINTCSPIKLIFIISPLLIIFSFAMQIFVPYGDEPDFLFHLNRINSGQDFSFFNFLFGQAEMPLCELSPDVISINFFLFEDCRQDLLQAFKRAIAITLLILLFSPIPNSYHETL